MKKSRVLAVAAIAMVIFAACGGDGETGGTGEDGGSASVSFVSPEDGAEVSSPVQVEMQAEGITIEPADAGVNEGAGHFHIVVDAECVAEGEVIPKDDQHRHFGDGSTQAELELEPGEHTLCLQVGNGAHEALAPTDEITITVTE